MMRTCSRNGAFFLHVWTASISTYTCIHSKKYKYIYIYIYIYTYVYNRCKLIRYTHTVYLCVFCEYLHQYWFPWGRHGLCEHSWHKTRRSEGDGFLHSSGLCRELRGQTKRWTNDRQQICCLRGHQLFHWWWWNRGLPRWQMGVFTFWVFFWFHSGALEALHIKA